MHADANVHLKLDTQTGKRATQHISAYAHIYI